MTVVESIREVQASEAKARLSELLDDVERGETVWITRHGERIARLEPEASFRLRSRQAAADRLRSRWGARPVNVEAILSARDEGRK